MNYLQFINEEKSFPKELTDLDKIMEFNKIINRYQYGFYNGKKYTGKLLDDEKIFMKKYKLMDSETVKTYQVFVCWDATRFEAEWFNRNVPNIKYECYYCEYEPNIGNSHTWLMFQYNNEWYVFESSWYIKQGVRKVNKNDLINKYIKDIPKTDHPNLKNGKYILFIYDPLKDSPGINCMDFMNNKWKYGKFVKTNCKSNKEIFDTFEFSEEDLRIVKKRKFL